MTDCFVKKQKKKAKTKTKWWFNTVNNTPIMANISCLFECETPLQGSDVPSARPWPFFLIHHFQLLTASVSESKLPRRSLSTPFYLSQLHIHTFSSAKCSDDSPSPWVDAKKPLWKWFNCSVRSVEAQSYLWVEHTCPQPNHWRSLSDVKWKGSV